MMLVNPAKLHLKLLQMCILLKKTVWSELKSTDMKEGQKLTLPSVVFLEKDLVIIFTLSEKCFLAVSLLISIFLFNL